MDNKLVKFSGIKWVPSLPMESSAGTAPTVYLGFEIPGRQHEPGTERKEAICRTA